MSILINQSSSLKSALKKDIWWTIFYQGARLHHLDGDWRPISKRRQKRCLSPIITDQYHPHKNQKQHYDLSWRHSGTWSNGSSKVCPSLNVDPDQSVIFLRICLIDWYLMNNFLQMGTPTHENRRPVAKRRQNMCFSYHSITRTTP